MDIDKIQEALAPQKQKYKRRQQTTELCPYCDTEVSLPPYLGIYLCPSCGKAIITCSMCTTMNCDACELYKATRILNPIKQVRHTMRENEINFEKD